MIVDAQMISQLVERQDLEDKKQIGLFGSKTPAQIVNPQLVEETMNKVRQGNVAKKLKDGDEELADMEVSQILAQQVKEHDVLKVDRSCLQCSGNNNQVI